MKLRLSTQEAQSKSFTAGSDIIGKQFDQFEKPKLSLSNFNYSLLWNYVN